MNQHLLLVEPLHFWKWGKIWTIILFFTFISWYNCWRQSSDKKSSAAPWSSSYTTTICQWWYFLKMYLIRITLFTYQFIIAFDFVERRYSIFKNHSLTSFSFFFLLKLKRQKKMLERLKELSHVLTMERSSKNDKHLITENLMSTITCIFQSIYL